MAMSVPPFHFDSTTAALRRKFGQGRPFTFFTKFLNVSKGVHPAVPYILKRSGGRGRDRQPGAPLTYPAVVMNMEA